jgi:peptide/nickel transport system substrate-binding protein
MRRIFLVALVGLALAVTACGSSSPSEHGTAKPVLRWADATAPTNLDPAIDINQDLASLAYTPIIHLQPNGSYSPGLALSWGYVGTGNKTFQFTLRTDARFSDGTSVTAQAVNQWLRYFAGAKGAFADNIPFKTIQTVGKWKVILHLTRPTPNLPWILSEPDMNGFVASAAALKDPNQLKTRTFGAGPYMLDPSETVAGDHYTYVPNPYYWDKSAIHYSKVIYRTITQPTSMLAALESGQIDVGFGDLSTVNSAAAAGLNVISVPTTGWVGMLLLDRGRNAPSGAPDPLASLDVRQALNYAVDRDAITKAFIGKYGVSTDEMPTSDGWTSSLAHRYAYDPTKAKQLLAAAGYSHGFTLNVLAQGFFGTLGEPYLQAIGKYLSAVGVNLNITNAPTLNGYMPEYLGPDYEATGFIEGPVISAFSTYTNWYGPNAYVKHHGWDDPVLDKLYTNGVTAPDPAIYAKAIVARLVDQADELVVSTRPAFWYTSKNVGGVQFGSVSGSPFPAEWYPTH